MDHSPPPPGDLLTLTAVRKYFPVRAQSMLARRATLQAVDGVDVTVPRGTTYGIVGESGSGKSTLARLIVRLTQATSGTITLAGRDVTHLRGRRLRQFRRDVQMVFQDPYSSFDPTSPLWATVVESLEALEGLERARRRDRAAELFDLVGLRQTLIDRYPNQLSGGQLQRAAIARALATRPDLLVLDEPVSSLDLSTQGQIINLLDELCRSSSLTYVLVAHDLAVVRHACERIAVMHLGRIVEEGPADEVYERPLHPYTTALLAAIPRPEPGTSERPARIILQGDPPSPIDPPSGCRFRTRCPWAMKICAREDPPATTNPAGSQVYCHLHSHGPKLDGASVRTLGTPEPAATVGDPV